MAGNVSAAAGAKQAPAAGKSADEFNPFYERIAAAAPEWVLPKFSLPLLLAVGYYLLHRQAFAGSELKLYPELLAAIIFVIPVLVYIATGLFRGIFGQMDNRVGSGRAPTYGKELGRLLSDRKFLIASLAFGAANLFTARGMGLELENAWQTVTIGIGFFLAGAACGVAVWGVYGIVQTIRTYVHDDRPRYDFTAPDGCGGMLFLGRAVTSFGIIALFGGVLITTYILFANAALHVNLDMGAGQLLGDAAPASAQAETALPGHSSDHSDGHSEGDSDLHMASPLEQVMFWIWIAVPYLLSTTVLLAPTIAIHNGLHAYKVSEDQKIEAELADMDAAFKTGTGGADALQSLRIQHTRASDRRKTLFSMSTWPFSLKNRLNFSVLVVVNALWTLSRTQAGDDEPLFAGILKAMGL